MTQQSLDFKLGDNLRHVREVKELYEVEEVNRCIGNGDNWRLIDVRTSMVRKTSFETTQNKRGYIMDIFFYDDSEVGHELIDDKLVTKYVIGRFEPQ